MLSRFATFVGSLTCSHRWIRARWEDGSYGLRCQRCFKRHPRTWDQLLARPESPVAVLPVRSGAGASLHATEAAEPAPRAA